MPRRKAKFKIPFFKFKINSKTIFNLLGFSGIAFGIIIILSFLNIFSPEEAQGRILFQVNQFIVAKFGGLSVFTPFVILLISGHFFNTKKLKFVKLNITLGMVLMLIAFMGMFRAGEWGNRIGENLTLDFTGTGAFIILLIALISGIVLFFDTSIDVFVIMATSMAKGFTYFFKNHVARTSFVKDSGTKLLNQKQPKVVEEKEFIEDRKQEVKSKAQSAISAVQAMLPSSPKQPPIHNPNELNIKPTTHHGAPSTWIYPPLTLLNDIAQKEAERGDVNRNADIIEKTLDSFGIRARVTEVNKGPTVTQYALSIAMGTKLSKITALANDLALALAAPTGAVRIEAPIPGRSLVGIEIPNIKPEIVTLKRILMSPVFTKHPDPLLVPLGLDVSGEVQAASISKMPHVLIAGTTGSGKSVILNAWISTFLFRTKPEDLRMILVDPKRVELALYNGIPHLLTEVIVEPNNILKALQWTVGEMERRYKEFAKVGVRNLDGYNALEGVQKEPYILFVIDELADLMMFAPGDAEDLITRIAQMARATGIHLILATQRPSVDVITGLMKANIPTRLAFNVSSLVDSRVIIDTPGAEKLLGKGDMLFLPPDQAKPRRIQGAFVMEKEVFEVVRFLKSQFPEVHYTEEITTQEVVAGSKGGLIPGTSVDGQDALFKPALELIAQFDKASASLLQRKLKVGYARAARILDELHEAGYVGPAEGSKPRDVLKRMAPESAEME
ncbi:MAG: hypothetical protein RI947_1367 [Candidatus Parcubacteria bacterium]